MPKVLLLFVMSIGCGKVTCMMRREAGGNNYENKNLAKYALPESAVDATGQLHNLTSDPGEKTNLFFSEEEKRKELQQQL